MSNKERFLCIIYGRYVVRDIIRFPTLTEVSEIGEPRVLWDYV